MLMSGIAVSYAQYGTGRALLAYPMKGQTLEQENADRSACHDWAVAQTGYDPTLMYAAQQYWITAPAAGASYEHPRYPHQSGGFVGAMGNAERRRLNETLLRLPSGRTGLLRGQRLPSFKIGASNANFDL
jgi:hypothetical protein